MITDTGRAHAHSTSAKKINLLKISYFYRYTSIIGAEKRIGKEKSQETGRERKNTPPTAIMTRGEF